MLPVGVFDELAAFADKAAYRRYGEVDFVLLICVHASHFMQWLLVRIISHGHIAVDLTEESCPAGCGRRNRRRQAVKNAQCRRAGIVV